MKLGSTFTVPADPKTVFDMFFDPDTMRACIPGCEELVRVDETHYTGRLVNEIAHVRFNAAFSAEITGVDAPREVKAILKGEDRRLGSSLKLDATLSVEPGGADSSQVTYAMEMAMWGKLGRMGESIFRRRTAEVEKQFVAAFSRAASGEPVAEESTLTTPSAVPAPQTSPAPAVASRADTEPDAALSVNLPLAVAGLSALGLLVVGWLMGRRSGAKR